MSFTVLPDLATNADISPANWTLWIRDNFAASPAALATSKGDIFPASGNKSTSRKGVGTDGQILESDSSQATGVKDSWGFVPVGGIIMWSGLLGSLPSNWQICDGTNSTPNLRDRFIIGAGGAYAVGASGGSTTANIQHSHTEVYAEGGSHTHTQGVTGAGSSHLHGGTTSNNTGATSIVLGVGNTPTPTPHTHGFSSASDAAHTHTNPTSGAATHTHTTTTNTQLSTSQDIRPPYYALAYIMRLS